MTARTYLVAGVMGPVAACGGGIGSSESTTTANAAPPGEVNFYRWRTDESIPPAWADLVDNGRLRVDIVLHLLDEDTVIEATARGVTVIYRPTNDVMPEC